MEHTLRGQNAHMSLFESTYLTTIIGGTYHYYYYYYYHYSTTTKEEVQTKTLRRLQFVSLMGKCNLPLSVGLEMDRDCVCLFTTLHPLPS